MTFTFLCLIILPHNTSESLFQLFACTVSWAQVGLTLRILLPQSPECQEYQCVSSHPEMLSSFLPPLKWGAGDWTQGLLYSKNVLPIPLSYPLSTQKAILEIWLTVTLCVCNMFVCVQVCMRHGTHINIGEQLSGVPILSIYSGFWGLKAGRENCMASTLTYGIILPTHRNYF